MTAKRAFWILMFVLIAVPCAFAQEGGGAIAVDAPKIAAVVDTSRKSAGIDTLKPAAIDTSKKSAGIDTSKAAVSIDTSKKAVAVDTSKTAAVVVDTPKITTVDTPTTAVIDTSKKAAAIDTPKAVAVVDTSKEVAAAVDTSEAVANVGTPPAPFAFAYTFHIIIFVISVTVITLTVRFFLARRDSRRFLTTTRLSVLDKSVQRGCRYIEANYGDPELSPEKVCKALVTGIAYLDALFMNELGINVQDFIVQVRVNAIKNALASPQLPDDLREVCVKCGFRDRVEAEGHFARICGGIGIAEYGRSLRR